MGPIDRYRMMMELGVLRRKKAGEAENWRKAFRVCAAVTLGALLLSVLLAVAGCGRVEEKWEGAERTNTGCWDVDVQSEGRGRWKFVITSNLAEPMVARLIVCRKLIGMDGKYWEREPILVKTIPQKPVAIIVSLPEFHGSFSWELAAM